MHGAGTNALHTPRTLGDQSLVHLAGVCWCVSPYGETQSSGPMFSSHPLPVFRFQHCKWKTALLVPYFTCPRFSTLCVASEASVWRSLYGLYVVYVWVSWSKWRASQSQQSNSKVNGHKEQRSRMIHTYYLESPFGTHKAGIQIESRTRSGSARANDWYYTNMSNKYRRAAEDNE